MAEGRGLYAVTRDRLRTHHLAYRTERTYLQWIRRYVLFHKGRHPREMGAAQVEAFLTHLAVEGHVSASTQNQAMQALLFLYKHVLDVQLPWIENVTRARRPKRLPEVMSVEQVRQVLAHLEGVPWLVANLLYGSGLRLTEALRLRVKDLDLQRHEILVRGAKGEKDRVTMLPVRLIDPLQTQLMKVRERFDSQRKMRHPGVSLPGALAQKLPGASTQWSWHYVFPAAELCKDPYSGALILHHVHERTVQRAVAAAVQRARILQRASCHTFRHCFATHLLHSGCDIRTIQVLMGHSDLRMTMIYTHVLQDERIRVKSPLD